MKNPVRLFRSPRAPWRFLLGLSSETSCAMRSRSVGSRGGNPDGQLLPGEIRMGPHFRTPTASCSPAAPYGYHGARRARTQVCIDGADAYPCLQFAINDSYGDRICCGYRPRRVHALPRWGRPWPPAAITASRTIVQFDSRKPGATCTDAVTLTEADYGTVTQAGDNFLVFVHATGQRHVPVQQTAVRRATRPSCISECCNMGNFDDTNEGSMATAAATRAVAARKRRLTVLAWKGACSTGSRWSFARRQLRQDWIGRLTMQDNLLRVARIRPRATTALLPRWTTARACTRATQPWAPDPI